MGCGYMKRAKEPKISSEIIDRVTQNVTSTKSNITFNNSISLPSSNSAHQCLKIKLLPKNEKFLSSNLSLSGTSAFMSSLEYAHDYMFLRETCSTYQSSFSYFCSQVHEACFTEFKIQYGIFILLISIHLNRSIEVTVMEDFPFIEVKGQLHADSQCMYESWTGFVKELQEIVKNCSVNCRKALRRIGFFVSGLKGSVEKGDKQDRIRKAIGLCEIAIETGNKVLSDVEKCVEDIKNFVRKYCVWRKELERLVEGARELEIYSGERIVHVLFNN